MWFASSDVVAEDVSRRLAGRHVLLLTDFDGTLADLTPTPDEATMTDSVRLEFAAIAAHEAVTTGVVSGRRADDVRARTAPMADYVAGLHGLEILGPNVAFTHPALASAVPLVADLLERASHALAWCPGLVLENKTYALTCHVRGVRPTDAARALAQFTALAEPDVAAHRLRLLHAADAREVLPAAEWNKGRAVMWIRSRVMLIDRPALLYLGDDRTDEDAFNVLEEGDVAIGVGGRPPASAIDWRLAGPASVGRFFARLERNLGIR